jgi:hypothetical protein
MLSKAVMHCVLVEFSEAGVKNHAPTASRSRVGAAVLPPVVLILKYMTSTQKNKAPVGTVRRPSPICFSKFHALRCSTTISYPRFKKQPILFKAGKS